jgi:hypothetical protein
MPLSTRSRHDAADEDAAENNQQAGHKKALHVLAHLMGFSICFSGLISRIFAILDI